jgi:DNA mismatch repair ATPase MutL
VLLVIQTYKNQWDANLQPTGTIMGLPSVDLVLETQQYALWELNFFLSLVQTKQNKKQTKRIPKQNKQHQNKTNNTKTKQKQTKQTTPKQTNKTKNKTKQTTPKQTKQTTPKQNKNQNKQTKQTTPKQNKNKTNNTKPKQTNKTKTKTKQTTPLHPITLSPLTLFLFIMGSTTKV